MWRYQKKKRKERYIEVEKRDYLLKLHFYMNTIRRRGFLLINLTVYNHYKKYYNFYSYSHLLNDVHDCLEKKMT